MNLLIGPICFFLRFLIQPVVIAIFCNFFQLTCEVWFKLTKAINTNLENIKLNFRVVRAKIKMRCFIYWRYLVYAAGATSNNDSYFIENQELQLSSDSKVGSKFSKVTLWKGFAIYFFLRKKSVNPSKFVEGIILDEDAPTNELDNAMGNDVSGFDLVMGLGTTGEDTGLDLVRGNNNGSSDNDENRRLRKLNQDSLTAVLNFWKILKFSSEYSGWLIFVFSISRKVVVIGETDVRIQCVLSIALEIFWIKWLIVSSIQCRTRLNGNGKDSLKIPKILLPPSMRQTVFGIFRLIVIKTTWIFL